VFRLEEWRFREGDVDLRLQRAPDLEPVIGDVPDLERPPYWVALWPAGVALARALARSVGLVGTPPAPLLELGCGVGLVGIVAAALGARVVQTDYIPAALSLAGANARRNEVNGIRRVAADWRAWPLRGRFPLVLGADITYDRELHPPLRAVLEATLAPGGVALIADPGRRPSLAFFAGLERDGWQVELSELETPAGATPVFLYRALRAGAPGGR
jgi:predicted nicotinamide N-methyase